MKKRILIIEDEPSISEILKEFLEDEGFVVFLAGHGIEALDLIKENGFPDLILSDNNMPIMNGLEFRKIQLTNNDLSRIPFILMSAKFDLDLNDFLNPTFIHKPIDLDNILEIIMSHLS